MDEQNLTTKKKKKWLLPTIIAVIVVIAAISAIIVYNLPANRLNRQLALAEKYMSELNYEAAILAYKAAIEIDPKCEKAYVGLVDLYIAIGDYDEAEFIFNTATLYLNSDILLSKYNDLKLLISDNDSNTDDNDEAEQNIVLNKEDIQSNDLILVKKAFNYNGAGELTSWSECEYDINNDLIVDTLYDNENNIIHQYNYDSLGNITSDSIGRPWEEKVYDENGRIIQWLVHKSGIDTTLQFWKGYFYDEHNNVINITTYNSDSTVLDYTEYIYDENSNLYEYIEYYSDGIVSAYHTFDSLGNEISVTRYNHDETIGGINYIFNYNSNNQLIKKTGYNSDDTLYDWTEYAYASTGNQSSVVTYNSDNLITSYYGYEYDVNGNCTIEEHYTNYNSEYDNYYIIKNIYDEQNNLLKSESFNRDGDLLFKTEYSYDYK